ncbi:MAG: protein kinase domain-containing protein [Pyrinomonadaceae bacterium]
MIEAGKFLQQRYRIDKQIGQGGMGAVYVATDERFGSTVAIKETLCMDDSFRKAIEREARLLNSLKHNALPRVSDHFEEDNGLFLVMEYIPGDDVATILEGQNAPFPFETVEKWAVQLLDALDYLHNQNVPVIHRDIKPQNLKLNARGDIILLDFGLAKGNPTDASHQTAAKSIFGYSRSYASLEQIQGTGTDPRSDLYSLAATLYHLVTNVVPEDALTRAMSVLSQKGDTLRPACEVESAVPRGFAGVLQKAMDLNAGQRPTSAEEMSRMLRESENYAYLTDIDFAQSATASNTNILAQETRLMGDSTAAGIAQRNVRTEVLTSHVSELTSLKAASTAAPKSRRGLAIAAGALAVLTGGSAVAGGIYLLAPSTLSGPETETSTTPPSANDVSTISNVDSTTNVNSSVDQLPAQSTGLLSSGESATNETRTRDPKPVLPAKDKNDKDMETITDEDGTVVQFPKDGKKGDVILTEKNPDGSTTTTTVRDGKMPTINTKPPMPGAVPPPGFNPRNLTPEQRRRLRNAIRNGQIQPIRPAPTLPSNKP